MYLVNFGLISVTPILVNFGLVSTHRF
jgi:hypothetical protein